MLHVAPNVVSQHAHRSTKLHFASDEHQFSNESACLLLLPDDNAEVKAVEFKRDEQNLIKSVGDVLGLHDDRIRCFSLPFFYKHGYALHMYIDLQGVARGLPHNSNATQLWLIANLPDEPPEVTPDAIHGPVLLTAEDANGSGFFIDLSQEDWENLKIVCQEVQPSATFLS